jgi:cellulose synthase/poly-beta-1,6-N-acetylglucosamine synthase-like glycosyltransferase
MLEPLKLLAYLIFGLYALTAVWLLLNGLVQLHLLWHYKRTKKNTPETRALPLELPFVSIQIPVYNEQYVISRLLKTLSRIDYPKDRFEIQVLDDSTDESCAIIDAEVGLLRQEGIAASVLRRSDRSGFKAGALQAGLPYCKGELIAIFDADFTPQPQFLKRLIPYFSDPKVGLAQARWSHLNQDQNALTRIQTYLLDTHFSVEQTGRANAGYFINFCGTAGIWRKSCIEDAGGWDGRVLSEDLDLSYRAQLKGWKLVYDQETAVPAELPSVIEAFKVQQFRWTKGMAQISKKNLGALIGTALPLGKKIHGVFHLLSSFVFVCLFLNAVLTVPMLVFRNLYPEIAALSRYTLVTSINLIALTLFYYTGTRTFRKKDQQFFRHYPLFLVVYMGLSVQNSCAVLQGFFGRSSVFVRTPKMAISDASSNVYLSNRISWINVLEFVLLCYFLCGIALSIYFNDYFLLLFFIMIIAGLSFIVYQSVAHTKPVLALRAFLF